ncbi:hypothetical protein WJX81_004289 [Elliptochloris bilobata]|uniref:RAP domain-containing protein n=1 Tax=Elliptochloris bilobata TaxID=381761 RepID=A0AAW1RCW4_9CHLO
MARQHSTQNLSNLCWAFAKSEEDDSRHTNEVQLEAQHGMVAAAACFRYDDAAPMDALACEACKRLDASIQPGLRKLALNPQNISNLLYAHADLANLVRSLCVLQVCDMGLWHIAMATLSAQLSQPADMTDEDLLQVFQAYELLRLDVPADEAVLAAAAPPGLLNAARANWAKLAQDVTTSHFHHDVARVLRSRGVAHQLEALTSDGLLSVDIVLPGERIALEADGPSHFAVNTHRPGGSMIARHRLLAARGWAVVSIPYYLWDHLKDAVRGAWLLQEIKCLSL